MNENKLEEIKEWIDRMEHYSAGPIVVKDGKEHCKYLISELEKCRALISQHHQVAFSRLSPGEACPICQKHLEDKR